MKSLITEVIDLLKDQPTTMIGSQETTRTIQVDSLARHARTMIMMYRATGDRKYLKQARLDIWTARDIQAGHQRPLGVHKAA